MFTHYNSLGSFYLNRKYYVILRFPNSHGYLKQILFSFPKVFNHAFEKLDKFRYFEGLLGNIRSCLYTSYVKAFYTIYREDNACWHGF